MLKLTFPITELMFGVLLTLFKIEKLLARPKENNNNNRKIYFIFA